MKKIIHLLYLIIIGVLVAVILFLNNTESSPVSKSKKQKKSIVHWTYDIDYSKLTKIKEPKLLAFIENIESIVSNHQWENFIANCDPEHYKSQLEDVGISNGNYVHNNLMVFSNYEHNIEIINKFPEVEGNDEYASLNLISKMKIIGINEDEYDNFKSLYGYLQLNDDTILAVNIWINQINGIYFLTGAVG